MSFFYRHQPKATLRTAVLAGVGAMIGMGVLALASTFTPWALLMAPFGASCVLLFAVPESPLSQPMNVVGGHVLATLVSLGTLAVLPHSWWAVAVAVGLSIGLMVVLRVTHPPAGADCVVVFMTQAGWSFVFVPVLTGSVVLVAIAYAYHRTSGTAYPRAVAISVDHPAPTHTSVVHTDAGFGKFKRKFGWKRRT